MVICVCRARLYCRVRFVIMSPAASVAVDGPASGRTGVAVPLTAAGRGCQPAAGGWQWLTAGGEIAGDPTGAAVEVLWSSAGTKRLSVFNSACGDVPATHTVAITATPVSGPPPPPSANG